MYGLVSRAELKAKLDRGDLFVLVDTLPETAYRKSHLPGAISIPSDDMLAVAPKRIPDRGADIVVYCGNGPCKRSSLSADQLRQETAPAMGVLRRGGRRLRRPRRRLPRDRHQCHERPPRGRRHRTGALLGSNVLAIPMMVLTAYFATRKRGIGEKGGHENHEAHRREHLLQVDPQAVTVQALPYLAVIALFAVLTLPAPWRGLQPIDGWILLVGYLVYLAQALLRGRKDGESVDWKRKEKWTAAAGIAALAVGAYFTVFSTEKIVSAVGISKIIGGLFITAPVAALPEVFATWYVARSGQVTSGVTSVIGDHTVTMTLAFIPLTIVGMPIENFQLFWVTLGFVALMPALYAGFIWWGSRDAGFTRWQVAALPAVYALFVAVLVFWVSLSAGRPRRGRWAGRGSVGGEVVPLPRDEVDAARWPERSSARDRCRARFSPGARWL